MTNGQGSYQGTALVSQRRGRTAPRIVAALVRRLSGNQMLKPTVYLPNLGAKRRPRS